MKKPRFNQHITLTIHSFGRFGEGVGYWQKYPIFVDGALPNEVIRGRISEKNRSYGRAKIEMILSPSCDRVEPPCPYANICGGCQLMQLTYEAQLNWKKNRVIEALKERVDSKKILDCEGSKDFLGYRCKIQYPCRGEKGDLKFGFYERRTKNLIPADKCLLHTNFGEMIFKDLKEILNRELSGYDEETKAGELRYAILRTSSSKKEAILILVITDEVDEFRLKEISKQILEKIPLIKGVFYSLNISEENCVLGDVVKPLAGREFLEEKMLNLELQISPSSFFQVNPTQALKMYEKAIQLANFRKEDILLDGFCGVGTFALLASSYVNKVLAFEFVIEAIDDAKINAKRNQIQNVEFFQEDAKTFLNHLEKIDVAFINPPRSGCGKDFLEKLLFLKPRKILYMSCNPRSLQEDLLLLQSKYEVENVFPYDMFPQTYHVELLADLTLKPEVP